MVWPNIVFEKLCRTFLKCIALQKNKIIPFLNFFLTARKSFQIVKHEELANLAQGPIVAAILRLDRGRGL